MTDAHVDKQVENACALQETEDRVHQEMVKFNGDISKESDRAAVILIGARLDYLLGQLLSLSLLANTGSIPRPHFPLAG
jgi:hypothetical protein